MLYSIWLYLLIPPGVVDWEVVEGNHKMAGFSMLSSVTLSEQEKVIAPFPSNFQAIPTEVEN